MPGLRKCRCSFHEISCQSSVLGNPKTVLSTKNRKINYVALQRLKEKNLIINSKDRNRAIFVCEKCVNFIQNDIVYNEMAVGTHNSQLKEKPKQNQTNKKRGRKRTGTI